MRERVIDGRFELRERLGGGGMGLVWRAWDTALHRDVALKEVRPPDPAMDEHDPALARELRARVLREARALARLNHPHVATIHHIVDEGTDTYPWLVMELVTGGSLQDRLAHGPMPPAEVARLGREVLSALRAAHAVGIQHRDVKPANVLLRSDGRSVLTDFGIAAVREAPSLTATGSFIGSPEYMAPERINGHEGDPASDLWSLGMMLYVAVEGRHPLRRATTLATLAAVLNQEVPPPERAGALGPALMALLNRDPSARPGPETLDHLLTVATDAPSAHGGGPFGGAPPVEAPTRPPGGPYGHQPAGSSPTHPPGPFGGSPYPPPRGAVTHPPGRPYGGPPAPAPYGMPTQGRTAGKRKTGRIVGAISAAAVVAVAAVVWTQLPSSTGSPQQRPEDAATLAAPARTPTEDPTPEAETTTPTPRAVNLHTETGMRDLIKAMKPVIGGTKVYGLTVYPTYASAEAPAKARKGAYDRYFYRDGVVTKQEGFGHTTKSPAVDLESFDWSVLPALFRKAPKALNVPKPTSRYLIVDTDFPFTGATRQVLLVYLSDEYDGGYLVADRKGKILKTNPAG
ncbi:serine/threonine-protein kinase [Nonomuraea sp. ATR24]|uniref:serine/threonine-protein kinase n=1 Tax=Nonomuraea sp. ATR24 TaxID=1676744 RepID=UPI0035C25BD3